MAELIITTFFKGGPKKDRAISNPAFGNVNLLYLQRFSLEKLESVVIVMVIGWAKLTVTLSIYASGLFCPIGANSEIPVQRSSLLSVSQISVPPVWGFIKLFFVDVENHMELLGSPL